MVTLEQVFDEDAQTKTFGNSSSALGLQQTGSTSAARFFKSRAMLDVVGRDAPQGMLKEVKLMTV